MNATEKELMLQGTSSLEAEVDFLGCLLRMEMHGNSPWREAALHLLTPEDFAYPESRILFAGALGAIRQGLDATGSALAQNVTTAAQAEGYDPNSLSKFLLETTVKAAIVPSPDQQIHILREYTRRRRLWSLTEQLRQGMQTPTTTGDLLTQAGDALHKLTRQSSDWQNMQQVSAAAFAYVADRAGGEIKPAQTVSPALTECLGGGFNRGGLYILSARTGGGKSAFAMANAVHMAKQDTKVCVISREMSAAQYGLRLLSADSGVWLSHLTNPQKTPLSDDQWQKVGDSLNRLSTLPILFSFTLATVEELAAEVRALADTGKCDVLIIDYLQILETKQKVKSDYERISRISRGLKQIALDCNIAVLALSQVRRGEGQLTLSDLRESGQIEQDADAVLFLNTLKHGDNLCKTLPDWMKEAVYKMGNTQRPLLLDVAKNRMGSLQSTLLRFTPGLMQFEDV